MAVWLGVSLSFWFLIFNLGVMGALLLGLPLLWNTGQKELREEKVYLILQILGYNPSLRNIKEIAHGRNLNDSG